MSEEEMDEITREEFWGAMNHLGRDINKIGALLAGATVHMVTSSVTEEEIQEYLAAGDIVYNVQTKEVRLKFDIEKARKADGQLDDVEKCPGCMSAMRGGGTLCRDHLPED